MASSAAVVATVAAGRVVATRHVGSAVFPLNVGSLDVGVIGGFSGSLVLVAAATTTAVAADLAFGSVLSAAVVASAFASCAVGSGLVSPVVSRGVDGGVSSCWLGLHGTY